MIASISKCIKIVQPTPEAIAYFYKLSSLSDKDIANSSKEEKERQDKIHETFCIYLEHSFYNLLIIIVMVLGDLERFEHLETNRLAIAVNNSPNCLIEELIDLAA